MSMTGDFAYEQTTEGFCMKLEKKIKECAQNPEAVKALKELGLETVNEYAEDAIIKLLKKKPKWIVKYQRIFK
jgi:hypothetical protein